MKSWITNVIPISTYFFSLGISTFLGTHAFENFIHLFSKPCSVWLGALSRRPASLEVSTSLALQLQLLTSTYPHHKCIINRSSASNQSNQTLIRGSIEYQYLSLHLLFDSHSAVSTFERTLCLSISRPALRTPHIFLINIFQLQNGNLAEPTRR